MKLYYIANIRMPTEKAHGIQIMEMCNAFAELGHEVELVVPRRKTDIKEDPFAFYNIEPKFKIKRLWCLDWVRFGKLGFWIQSVSFAKRMALYALGKNGLFYTRDELNAVYLKVLGKKVAWEVHMGQDNLWARLLIMLKVPLITITGHLKKKYVSMGAPEKRILVAHDAFDTRRFAGIPVKEIVRDELGLPKDLFIIGYIGKYKTMGESKGIDDLMYAFGKVVKNNVGIYLLIVGPEKSEMKELEMEFEKCGVSTDSYKIIERVKHEKTHYYMRAADLLVLPYPNTPHYAYNMSPLKLFSYMGSGTPILASDLPSLREVLNNESAFFFNPNDPNGLNEGISAAIRDKDRVKKGKKALVDSVNYTWAKRAENILKFIG